MIGKLTGKIDVLTKDYCILDVQGVGYKVFCTSRTLKELSECSEKNCSLWIETYVREDIFRLYGFFNLSEKYWFNLLLNIHGVGTKASMSILSIFSVDLLTELIQKQDVSALSQAPGIGKKVAGRIITELKSHSIKTDSDGGCSQHFMENSIFTDASLALCTLGYSKDLVEKTLRNLLSEKDGSNDLKTLIRLGLKELSRET